MLDLLECNSVNGILLALPLENVLEDMLLLNQILPLPQCMLIYLTGLYATLITLNMKFTHHYSFTPTSKNEIEFLFSELFQALKEKMYALSNCCFGVIFWQASVSFGSFYFLCILILPLLRLPVLQS